MPPKILLGFRNVVLRSSDAVVYLEYNPRLLPPKPSGNQEFGEKWTRFVCISDSHSRTYPVPDGDVLLHSGDLTDVGRVSEFEKITKWLYALPHAVKIVVAGNHDITLDEDWYDVNGSDFHKEKQDLDRIRYLLNGPEATEANLIYLQDTVHKFKVHEDGKEWSVYGSPWSPEYGNWAFNYTHEDDESTLGDGESTLGDGESTLGDGESTLGENNSLPIFYTAQALVAKIPPTDILLTHCPPHQIFDRESEGSDVGCEALRARLPSLKPRLHLFGHIHEAHGAHIHKWTGQDMLPVVQNASSSPASEDSETQNRSLTQEAEESTVFVNASNYPMGALAVRDGIRMNLPGGPGFQPVVVDLKE